MIPALTGFAKPTKNTENKEVDEHAWINSILGKTSAGLKGRGLRRKGHLLMKGRPSFRASYKRRNAIQLRRYRWFILFLEVVYKTQSSFFKLINNDEHKQ